MGRAGQAPLAHAAARSENYRRAAQTARAATLAVRRARGRQYDASQITKPLWEPDLARLGAGGGPSKVADGADPVDRDWRGGRPLSRLPTPHPMSAGGAGLGWSRAGRRAPCWTIRLAISSSGETCWLVASSPRTSLSSSNQSQVKSGAAGQRGGNNSGAALPGG